MSPVPGAGGAPITTTAPPVEPVHIDGYAAAMEAALSGHRAGAPDAAGRALLSGMQNFGADETGFRAAVDAALGSPDAAAPPPRGAASPGPVDAGAPASQPSAMDQAEALQRRSMGVMMQTYSFALEATLVTNAATTFTSSVNTLIKTQ